MNTTTANLTVTEATARENMRREADRKAANKAFKKRQKQQAEAARQERQQQRAAIEAQAAISLAQKTIPVQAPAPKFGNVTKLADPREVERLRAKADNDLRCYRRQQAELTYNRLVKWLKDEKLSPSWDEELIVREFKAALFMPSTQEGEDGVYICEGVKIRANEVAFIAKWAIRDAIKSTTSYTDKLAIIAENGFTPYGDDDRGNLMFECDGITFTLFGSGAAERSSKRGNSNLTTEQQQAADRRAQPQSDRIPATPVDRAKREAKRESNRAERLAAQPPKGKGGQKDQPGSGKKKKGAK